MSVHEQRIMDAIALLNERDAEIAANKKLIADLTAHIGEQALEIVRLRKVLKTDPVREAAEVALKWLHDDRWGLWRYMTSKEFYDERAKHQHDLRAALERS